MRKVNIFFPSVVDKGVYSSRAVFLVTHVVKGTRSVVMISSVQEASNLKICSSD